MPTIIAGGPMIPDLDTKRKLVAELTDAAVRAYGLPKETIVVVIEENPPQNVAVGGTLIIDRK